MEVETDPDAVGLAELVATLSLAQDSAFGQPLESELRTCLLSVWIAEAMGATRAEREHTWYAALLRYVGCTGHAHEASTVFGDEIAARARSALYDSSQPAEVLLEIVRHAGGGRSFPERLKVLASVLAGGRKGPEMNFRTGCEVAELLCERLGVDAAVREALHHTFERYGGGGMPDGTRGEAIPRPMRVVHLAQEMEVLVRFGGVDVARDMARRRSGRAYDPRVVECFCDGAAAWIERLERVAPWEEVLRVAPPSPTLTGDTLDEALLVVADFVDMKSPFTQGHSRGVAALAEAGASRCKLPGDETRLARRAGWVHDLGRAGVPNSIWDKPGPLTHAEWDRVRVHPLLTEQILARAPGLSRLRELAGVHHERLDGSGYHRQLAAPKPGLCARILAAADALQAMSEPRAHRPALAPSEAAKQLRAAAAKGALDPDATEAVLRAAGHRGRRRAATGGLSRREVEVLRLMARGLTTKEIAAALDIATKTADHHIQHIYRKIGVSTRGAAALYAVSHGLVEDG